MLARLVKEELERWGYDTFLDVDSIGAGSFPDLIVSEVRARDFLVSILVPGTLERCEDQDDWVRREIELALEAEITIIPAMVQGFKFKTQGHERFLSGELSKLPTFNGVEIHPAYFKESIAKLRWLLGETQEERARLEPPSRKRRLVENTRLGEEARERSSVHLPEASLATALGYWIQGHIDRTYNILSDLIKQNATYAPAHSYRGLFHLNMHMATYDNNAIYLALHDLYNAMKLDPTNLAVRCNIGTALQYSGRIEEAIAVFDKVLELDPRNAIAYYNRGNAYGTMERWQIAIEDYDRAIDLDPTYIEAFTNRGHAWDRQGDVARSIDDYNRALSIDPNFVNALINRSARYFDNKLYDASLADCNRVLAQEPTNSSALMNRAEVYYATQNLQAAVEDATTLLHKNAAHVGARLIRAKTYHAQGAYKKAINDYRRIITDTKLKQPIIAQFAEQEIRVLEALRK